MMRVIAVQVRPCRPTRAFRELISGLVSAESHHAATRTVPGGFSRGLGWCEGPVTPGDVSERYRIKLHSRSCTKALTIANLVVQ
jgi:hypothetical protein